MFTRNFELASSASVQTWRAHVVVGDEAAANLAPRDFGKGLVSHGMIMAAGPSEALVLPTIDDSVAVTMITEVDYRTGRKHDMVALTAKAHSVGAAGILFRLAPQLRRRPQ